MSPLSYLFSLQPYNYTFYDALKEAQIARPPKTNLTDTNSTATNSSTIGNTNTHSANIHVNGGNITNNGSLPDNYTLNDQDTLKIPEVRAHFLGVADTVFVWFRYLHFMIVPLIIFAIHKVSFRQEKIITQFKCTAIRVIM